MSISLNFINFTSLKTKTLSFKNEILYAINSWRSWTMWLVTTWVCHKISLWPVSKSSINLQARWKQCPVTCEWLAVWLGQVQEMFHFLLWKMRKLNYTTSKVYEQLFFPTSIFFLYDAPDVLVTLHLQKTHLLILRVQY